MLLLTPQLHNRGVAQVVECTSGGREVAGSSPVTPTKKLKPLLLHRLFLQLHFKTHC